MRRAFRDLSPWRKIGITIRDTRKWRGMTELQVADELNLELKKYRKIEIGSVELLTLGEIYKLMELFNVGIDQIIII